MSEVARINQSKQIDWQRIKRSLDTVSCLRATHPNCEYHFTEAQAFKRISKLIRLTKDTIDELQIMKLSVVPSMEKCELHWFANCSECSVLGRISRNLKIAKTRLGKLKFQLISLPTVAEALGRTQEDNRFPLEIGVAVETGPEKALTQFTFGRERDGFATSRRSRKDINDNIALIEAWLRSKAA